MEWKRHAEVQSLGYLYCRDSVRAWREAQKKEKSVRPLIRPGMSTELEPMKKGLSMSALDKLGPKTTKEA